jgi:transposase
MPWRAAERLGLSRRQVERLANRYRCEGAAGLVSRRRGRSGNRKLDEGLAQRALAIIRERYADFGPTLACEKLAEFGRRRPVGPSHIHDYLKATIDQPLAVERHRVHVRL